MDAASPGVTSTCRLPTHGGRKDDLMPMVAGPPGLGSNRTKRRRQQRRGAFQRPCEAQLRCAPSTPNTTHRGETMKMTPEKKRKQAAELVGEEHQESETITMLSKET